MGSIYISTLLTFFTLCNSLDSRPLSHEMQDTEDCAIRPHQECIRGTLEETQESGHSVILLQSLLRIRTAEHPPGILLWSQGRSATGTFMETLRATTGLEYCNGKKESFKDGYPVPSLESLAGCARRGELLMHVKPEHLLREGSTLRTAEAFFDAAFKVGFKVAVASFRENQLARDVSSYELNIDIPETIQDPEGYAARKLHLKPPGIVFQYEELRRGYSRGVTAATDHGFALIPFSFIDITENVCRCVHLTVKALDVYGDKDYAGALNCSSVNAHMDNSHRENSLEERTSKETAATIKAALSGTRYDWMLDLDAKDWPEDLVPPVPVPTWHRWEAAGLAERECSVLEKTFVSSPICEHTGSGPPGGFLVTGTGRSGTEFLAKLLQGLHMDVSHDDAETRGTDGAVSWIHGRANCPIPKWSYDVTRFFDAAYLMLREPLVQIASRSNSGSLSDNLVENFECEVQLKPLQSKGLVDESLEIALKHWVLQNSFVERYARQTFRLETVAEDPHFVIQLCKEYGGARANCSEANVLSVQHDLRDHVNHNHTVSTPGVTWSRLAGLDRGFVAMAQHMALKHGYELPATEVLPEAAFGYICGFGDGGLWTCTPPPEARSLLDDPFTLENLIRSKDAERFSFSDTYGIKLENDSVVSVAVARTGSETVTRMLKSVGQPAFHLHSCTVPFLLTRGVGHVIVSLRDPVARVISGFQRRTELAGDVDKPSNKVFVDEFLTLDSFVDALRNTSDEKHTVALDLAYRPESQSFLLPVVDFYLGGLGSPDTAKVSFVCTCQLNEDMIRVGKTLGLVFKESDSDTVTHVSTSKSDDPSVQEKFMSAENRDWLREIYAADEALYMQHCGATCRLKTEGPAALLEMPSKKQDQVAALPNKFLQRLLWGSWASVAEHRSSASFPVHACDKVVQSSSKYLNLLYVGSCHAQTTGAWSYMLLREKGPSEMLLMVVAPILFIALFISVCTCCSDGSAAKRGWVVNPSRLLIWCLHTFIVWGFTWLLAFLMAAYFAKSGDDESASGLVMSMRLSPLLFMLSPRSFCRSLIAFTPWPRPEDKKSWRNSQKFMSEIAVIVPCHMCANEIESSLSSYLKYFAPQQILIVDNSNYEKPQDGLEAVVHKISPKVNYIYVPQGLKSQALHIGVNAMPDYKYVLLMDDDTKIPDEMVFDESYFTEDDKIFGVGWARDIIQHNMLTRVVNFQMKGDAGQRRGGVYWALAATNTFLVGTMALYRRDYWLNVMNEHPCTPYGEDYFTGSFGLRQGYKLAFDLRSCCETFSPPVLTGWFNDYAREQGYGAATLFKQRAMRWYCTNVRNMPLVWHNILNYRTGGFVTGFFFRFFQITDMLRVPEDLLIVGGFIVTCSVSPKLTPIYLAVMYILKFVQNFSLNYVLWYGAHDHQHPLSTLLWVPIIDIVLHVFSIIGAGKCLTCDIWQSAYKWNVGCWKKWKHLKPNENNFKIDESREVSTVRKADEVKGRAKPLLNQSVLERKTEASWEAS